MERFCSTLPIWEQVCIDLMCWLKTQMLLLTLIVSLFWKSTTRFLPPVQEIWLISVGLIIILTLCKVEVWAMVLCCWRLLGSKQAFIRWMSLLRVGELLLTSIVIRFWNSMSCFRKTILLRLLLNIGLTEILLRLKVAMLPMGLCFWRLRVLKAAYTLLMWLWRLTEFTLLCLLICSTN